MRELILSTLLHYANARPPTLHRQEFYALKDRLLRRYGVPDGEDVQEIIKECWCNGDYGTRCYKCRGTLVYDRKWVRLQRWRFGKYVFHQPIETLRVPREGWNVNIRGLVQHPSYGVLSNEAALWLLVLCGWWGLFFSLLSASRFEHPRLYPLSCLQYIIFGIRQFWNYLKFRRRLMANKLSRRWKEFLYPVEMDDEIPF